MTDTTNNFLNNNNFDNTSNKMPQNNFQLNQHSQPNMQFNNNMGMNNMNNMGQMHPSRSRHQAANVLFVADLPDETCEEDLMGLFKDYQYKVSRVTNTPNRTYALVHFNSVEWAEKARNELNGVKIAAKYSSITVSKPIRLCRWETKTSISERKDDDYKKNLLVKNLNKDISAHYFWNIFKAYGDVRSSKLSIDFAGLSKGFGYITFYNVHDAEKAREALNNTEVAGKNISIEFLQPGLKKKLKKNNIYVKRFPKENYTQEDLKKLFEAYGELISVMVAPDNEDKTKNKGFGFVCFKNADNAEKAQEELNNKKIWEDQPTLYVNFAMKKEERMEHFQKRKEELIRNSSRMTVFCKVKEGTNFENEAEFNKEIMKFLNMFFGATYYPRSLKSRIETKTAFITLNSANEVEQFINYITDLGKTQNLGLYFNTYKSKVERINASNVMKKKYNDFNNTTGNNNNMNNNNVNNIQDHMMNNFYKNYNEFNQNMGNQGGMQNMGGQMNQFNNNNQMGNGQMQGMPVPDNMLMQNFQMFMQQQQNDAGMQGGNNMNNRNKQYNNFDDMNKNFNNMNINPQTSNPNTQTINQNQNNNNNFVGGQQNQVENQITNKNTNNVIENTTETMNNNNQNVKQVNNSSFPQKSNEEREEEEKGEILDMIFEYVSKIYSVDAPKITGMIGELNLQELKDLVLNEIKLEGVVKSAYNQLNN